MLAHIAAFWDRIRESLWALPLAIAAAGAGLAIAALSLELPWVSEIAWLYSGSASQAPQFASSLVSAMITLTALAFSITMVVLTLAAQQLGPRLIQIFMRDRGAQAALGLFLGTIVYLLLVLRALDGDNTGQAPNLAITGGTALVLASVVSLLFFVHSLARSIVSDHVIARIGDTLEAALTRAFGEQPSPQRDAPSGGAPIRLKQRGYVQRINYSALVRRARKCNGVLTLTYGPGAHVIDGEIDAWAHGGDIEALRKALASAVVIASERTFAQDPEWSVRQLVEIALRALSPGVNDEFTALAVIDRLARALAVMFGRCEPAPYWCDGDGAPRVFGPAPRFAHLIDAAFDQIREAGAGKQRVLERMAQSLAKLSGAAPHSVWPTLTRHAALVEACARRTLAEPGALTAISRHAGALIQRADI